MTQSIPVLSIRPNPFQSRRELDQHAIKQLADSIKESGLWSTVFRVRQRDGHYELAAGHQRLAALKLLGHKNVQAEVLDLDDLRMCEESLMENLQRSGLCELDRAEGISRLVAMELDSQPGKKNPEAAIERVRLLLGFEHRGTITSYMGMAKLSEPTKTVLRKENTGREIAKQAGYLGGEAMVRFAAEQHLGRHDIGKMLLAVTELPKEKREKVAARIIEKKITEPSQVTELVRREQAKMAPRDDAPPDLLMFVDFWTQQLKQWTPKLREAGKHLAYIKKHPEIAGAFKSEAAAFIEALRFVADIGDGK